MVNSASEMLISATIDFLQSYPPFDRMETDAFRFRHHSRGRLW